MKIFKIRFFKLISNVLFIKQKNLLTRLTQENLSEFFAKKSIRSHVDKEKRRVDNISAQIRESCSIEGKRRGGIEKQDSSIDRLDGAIYGKDERYPETHDE